MNIENKVFVITGGLSGLGKATVDYFSSLGARVAIFDIAAADINDEERRLHFQVDVTQEQQIRKALLRVQAAWGEVHGCINCAGIAPVQKVIDRANKALPLADFSRVVEINLLGTFAVCAQVSACMAGNLPDPLSGERGVIINTASIAAYDGQRGQCAYAASKGAIASMTLPMARDLATLAIRVVSIAPGVIATPMMMAMPDAVRDGLVAKVPFPSRLGLPEEFASLVAHVVGNSYINGEVIRIDGALRMA